MIGRYILSLTALMSKKGFFLPSMGQVLEILARLWYLADWNSGCRLNDAKCIGDTTSKIPEVSREIFPKVFANLLSERLGIN